MKVISSFRCPVHGHELTLCSEPDGDETGVWTVFYFECPETWHTYPAQSDGAGDYVPVDEEAD